MYLVRTEFSIRTIQLSFLEYYRPPFLNRVLSLWRAICRATDSQVLLQAGTLATIPHTVDRQALTPRTPQARPLESLHGVLASMQQLRTSFATIIMPEGLNSFLQEASVLEVGKRVEEIVASCGVSLEEVVAEIRLHTKCIMLGMDLPDLATV